MAKNNNNPTIDELNKIVGNNDFTPSQADIASTKAFRSIARYAAINTFVLRVGVIGLVAYLAFLFFGS